MPKDSDDLKDILVPTRTNAPEELSSSGFAGTGAEALRQTSVPLDPSVSEPAIEASRSLFEATRTRALEPEVPLSSVQDVPDTSIEPFRIVAHLRLTFGLRKFDGTAFFISPSVLLTAGHNLFFHNFGAAPLITVYPGRNGNLGYGEFRPRNFLASSGWLARDPDADYGVIALDRPLGATLGMFGVTDLAAGSNPPVLVSGYPAARPQGTQSFGIGAIVTPTASRISYAVATLHGQSGGPLLVNGTLTAVGVHVARPNQLAHAIRFTSSVRADIARLMRAL